MPDSEFLPIKAQRPQGKPVGVRVKGHTVISTRTGLIVLERFESVRDPYVVEQIQRSGAAFEPIYE